MLDDKRIPYISTATEEAMLTLTFSSGETLTVDVNSLNEDVTLAAKLIAVKNKLVDAAAIPRDKDTGRPASLAEKYAAVKEVFDRITSPDGTWDKIRGEGVVANSGLLVRALMQLHGKDKATITRVLDGMTNEEKTAIRNLPTVAALIAQLKLAATKVDTDSLMSRFG